MLLHAGSLLGALLLGVDALPSPLDLEDPRYQLDATGEPEWNLPAPPAWTLVNLSNVYGAD
jgi:hypothetical protein